MHVRQTFLQMDAAQAGAVSLGDAQVKLHEHELSDVCQLHLGLRL